MAKKIGSILLIDDDEYTNLLHQIVIEKTDVCDQIGIAETVEQAIELINQKMLTSHTLPELVFIDLNLPGLNGWDFIAAYTNIVRHSGRRSIIIVLTASISPDDAKKANAIPEVAGFMNKPLTTEMVQEITATYFS